MPVDISERDFQAQIEHVLRNEHGYHKRISSADPESSDFDAALCLLPRDVIDFIRGTQPESWARLRAIYQDETESKFLRRLSSEIGKRGALDVLRKGLSDAGQRFRLVYFAPATAMNPDYQRLYEGNVFSVVTELHYQAHAGLRLDLALFINGLPIFTAELKNKLSGQNARHALRQYQKDRDPKAPLFQFGRCLGHFAVDNDNVYVTTRLQGDKTIFLPLDQGKYGGAGNPPAHDNFSTHYLWQEVWAPDSLLNLLGQFIHTVEDGKAKKIIFPRYHQLDAVRRLLADARAKGAGRRYLIQHSAGSGKSYSIAWLAHQLSNLHNERDERVFDTVVVITDRRVLDRQLQQSIRQFEQTPGVVENIDQTSRQLRQALADGKKIIVTTLQKFPYIVEETGKLPGSKFAVIVDEAHSSQSGESVKSLKATLSTSDLGAAAAEEAHDDPPTWQDRIVESLRARKQQDNISTFAFTATPKNKTLELFGERRADGKFAAFSLYSMRQAIEEGFILDVLENYTTYRAYWRLLKTADDDPKVESGKAKRLLRRFVDLHPDNIAKKVEIIVEHFHQHVMRKIRGQSKAMIVTRSRLHAVRTYHALKQYLKARGYSYGALVAFSGAVDDGGPSFTEAGMNGFSDRQTAEAFHGRDFRFLVVANKFQTGFDEPLLAAMYVDKPLSGVHAVQTLSRLNRRHPQKQGAFVLDFANQAEHIQAAFKPYYEATLLSESSDHNLLYDHERALNDFLFYTQDEVNAFARAYFSERTKQQKLHSCLRPALDRFGQAAQDQQEEFRSRLMAYVRLYAFLSQVIPFEDQELEKLYVFARYLRRLLPASREQLPIEILASVDIDSYRVRQTSSGQLTPEPNSETLDPMLENEKIGTQEDPPQALSEIIDFLNETFGEDAPEAGRLVQDVLAETLRDIGVINAVRINPPDKARLTVEDVVKAAFRRRYKTHFDIFKRFSDDARVQKHIVDWIDDNVQDRLNARGQEMRIY